MGSAACGCLVAVGAYSVIISLAFVIVTILYSLESSDCTGVTVDHEQNIKKLVHYDIFAVDNSKNCGETVEKVDKDGEAQTIICNCGEKAILTIFEMVVLIAIAIGMVYVACGVCGHFRSVYLKRQQVALPKKEKAEKKIRDKLRLKLGLQSASQSADTGSGGAPNNRISANCVALDTSFS